MPKFSVYSLGFPGYSIEDVIKISSEIGFDGIDIRVREDGHIYIDSDRKYRRKLLELASSYDIDFYGIYSYLGQNFTTIDMEERDRVIELVEKHLDLAVDLNGIYLRIFSESSDLSEKAFKRYVEVCKTICRLAEDRNIFIGVETHGGLVWNSMQCNRLLREVDSPYLKIVYDVANIYRNGGDPLKEIKNIEMENIIAVQFHDLKKINNKYTTVLLGKGIVPFKNVIEYLRKKGYEKYVVDEYERWWNPKLPDPKIGLPYELNLLKTYFKV